MKRDEAFERAMKAAAAFEKAIAAENGITGQQFAF
jgi:hypothetical protein